MINYLSVILRIPLFLFGLAFMAQVQDVVLTIVGWFDQDFKDFTGVQ